MRGHGAPRARGCPALWAACTKTKGPRDEGPLGVPMRSRASGLRGRLHSGMVLEELLGELDEVLPLIGRFVFCKDRLHRAHGLAGPTVDALIRMDKEHRVALVAAV